MTEKRADLPAWEILIGSTALAIGAAFYIGYGVMGRILSSRFHFGGSPLEVWSYHEILLRGTDVFLYVAAPKLLGGLVAGFWMQRGFTKVTRRICLALLILPAAFVAVATPTAIAPVVFDMLARDENIALSIFYIPTGILLMEWFGRRDPLSASQWTHPVLLFGCLAYLVWVTPTVIRSDFVCFPRADVGGVVEGAYLTHRDDYFILGNAKERTITFLANEKAPRVASSGCYTE